MYKVTIPGAEEQAFLVNAMTEERQVSRFKTYVQNFAARCSAWQGKQLELSNAVWGGTAIKMHLDPADPHKEEKRTALREGLELLESSGGLAFPELGLEVWTYTGSQACLGYLLPLAGRLKAIVLLGDGVVSANGLVATEILRKNGGAESRAGRRKQVLAAILHEFGHCLHAYVHPERFLACNRLAQLRHAGSATRPDDGELFVDLPSAADFAAVAREVERISRTVSGYASKHPLELVAEVFAGVLMGETFGPEAMAAYAALGGPALPVVDPAPLLQPVRPRSAPAQAPIELIGEGL